MHFHYLKGIHWLPPDKVRIKQGHHDWRLIHACNFWKPCTYAQTHMCVYCILEHQGTCDFTTTHPIQILWQCIDLIQITKCSLSKFRYPNEKVMTTFSQLFKIICNFLKWLTFKYRKAQNAPKQVCMYSQTRGYNRPQTEKTNWVKSYKSLKTDLRTNWFTPGCKYWGCGFNKNPFSTIAKETVKWSSSVYLVSVQIAIIFFACSILSALRHAEYTLPHIVRLRSVEIS